MLRRAAQDRMFISAFTSPTIRRILRERGETVYSPAEALEALRSRGVTEVLLQPTHILRGHEYDKLKREAEPWRDRFDVLRVGNPLLSDTEDLRTLAADYELDGRLKSVKALRQAAKELKFTNQSQGMLTDWLVRRFAAAGKRIKLSFTEDSLDYMVDKAVEYKLGARGLRSIVEAVMTDAMFEVPSQKVDKFEVTLDYAQHQLDKAHLGQLESA